jgi:DNA-binding response OmpR family regulator
MAHILVADDEDGLLTMIRFALEGAGHKVDEAKNGRVAVELSKRNRYDAVVMDVMMPFMDGYHACAEITQAGDAPPPVLLLTSRDYDQDKVAVKASGATAFLSKPFEVSELLRVVQEMIQPA